MSIECRGVVRDCMPSSACSVGIVSSCSWWKTCCEIIGTLCVRKLCGVLSSVFIDPRSVGYICKSVDTWHVDALNSSSAFTSTCVRGGLASFLRQPNVSCRGVGKCPVVPVLYQS